MVPNNHNIKFNFSIPLSCEQTKHETAAKLGTAVQVYMRRRTLLTTGRCSAKAQHIEFYMRRAGCSIKVSVWRHVLQQLSQAVEISI
jgi:hypothetical protein